MCNCQNKRYIDDNIEGLNETDYMLFGGTVGGYIATAYIDNMLVYDSETGARKTGGLADADKDMMRNGLFAIGGLGIAYMWNEPLAKGAGIGMTTYGVKQMIRGQYPDAGIAGRTTTGQSKYIGGKTQQGQDKYIGAGMRNPTIDLTKNSQPNQQKEKVIIKNKRA